jgi:hypothetical protein
MGIFSGTWNILSSGSSKCGIKNVADSIKLEMDGVGRDAPKPTAGPGSEPDDEPAGCNHHGTDQYGFCHDCKTWVRRL